MPAETILHSGAEKRLLLEGAHALSVEATLAAVDSGPRGLSVAEAAARLEHFGRNELPRATPPGPLRVFLRQFLSPLVYILLVAAVISAAMQEWTDAGFILAVLIVNAIIGSIQEYGAEKSAEALRSLTKARALVVRDGSDREIPSEELVPGDLVLLEAGAKVPADLRLVSGAGFEADESLLTGESLAVGKRPSVVLAAETALGDRRNMAFAGSLLTRGRGYGVAVATGPHTQIGRIAASITAADTARPPLLERMDRFTKRIGIAVGIAALLLGAVLLVRGSPPAAVFTLAVALAVSAIPEGLPVALTVALAIGARRMSLRKVIARKLVAVEALGSCTFIASDKTGTLTMNELAVRRVALPGRGDIEVTGAGMSPIGEVLADPEDLPRARRLAVAGALCNDGFLGQRDGEWVHHGDAVDVALLALAAKASGDQQAVELGFPRVREIPFDPEYRFAATLHRIDGRLHAVVKGAGETVVPMCTKAAGPFGEFAIDRRAALAEAERLAAAGYRVLAVAEGEVAYDLDDVRDFDAGCLDKLVLLGFVGMIDPLRPETRDSILACRAAGIDVAVVTGDHPATALAIARELGLAQGPAQVVTGPELSSVLAQGEDATDELVRRARVFARVEPNHKLEIVQALIRLGNFVAVTGDGANDAPALRAAHIGVAMGGRGTDVARESAELIVTDDNFASIVAAVREGRVAYANVRKVIYLLVSTGAAELLLFVLTTAAGLPIPLLPVQLLWLNLVTNGIQDVALAFEPAEGGELDRPPRPPRQPIFDRLMLERVIVSGVLMAGVGFAAYLWMLDQQWTLPQAQSSLLLLFVLFENIQAGNSRSETVSLLRQPPMRNPILFFGTILAQLVHIGAMYTPGLRDVLGVEPVSLVHWCATLALALSLLVVSEIHKLLIRRRTTPGG